MERFLTPDGCSDPCYFARRALEEDFGNMDSVEERQLRTRGHLQIAYGWKKQTRKGYTT